VTGYASTALTSLAAATIASLADRHLAPTLLPLSGGEPSHPRRARRSLVRAIITGSVAAAACALVITRTEGSPALPADCCLATAAAPLGVSDLTTHRLPNAITLPATAVTAILLGLAAWQHHQPHTFGRAILAAAASAGFFLLIAIATHGVGAGDVKLAALTGLPLGWAGWNHLAVATLAGLTFAAVCAGTLLLTGHVGPHDPIPLGPFLLSGALLGILI
jgi:leader peptidase (prepilin peptidase) / N-methyltransferase